MAQPPAGASPALLDKIGRVLRQGDLTALPRVLALSRGPDIAPRPRAAPASAESTFDRETPPLGYSRRA